MRNIKNLIQSMGAALVSLTLLIMPFIVSVEAEPEEWSPPANGAGRIASCMIPEKTHDKSKTEIENLKSEETTQFLIEETKIVTEEYQIKTEETQIIPDPDPIIETDIDALIVEVAAEYGIPWELVSAVCWAESTYDPYAVSATPDYGLMQITASVMANYGLTADNWMDPAANLDAGCRILREKLDLSGGDFGQALTRYRFGDGEALAMWSRGEWSNWYAERVLGKYYEIIREGRR